VTLRQDRRSDHARFREWTYAPEGEPTVSRWLRLCEKVCDADRARWGLSQFREHLERRLGDASPSAAWLDLALTIGQGYDGLRQIIWKAFLEGIAETLRTDLGPEWEVSVQTRGRPSITLRRPSWVPQRCVFLGQIPEGQTYFGLQYGGATGAQSDSLKAALDGALGTSRLRNEYWLWHRAPDVHGWHDWSDRKTLLAMARAVEPIVGEPAT
jgi:hypothetical protein